MRNSKEICHKASKRTPGKEKAPAAAKQNQDLSMNQQPNVTETASIKPRNIDLLPQKAINHKVDELRKQARQATFVAGRLALAGQITVFFAGPNTGKTLITLALLSEARANGTAGDHTYHINLDDSFEGQIQKADLGNRHGFLEVTPQTFVDPLANFIELVDALVEEGSAKEAIFILDTLKKFTNPMDKKQSSQFMSVCRRFTSAGGTIIALSHTNKHTDNENKGIPAGTSDVLDDCDCAYILNITEEQKSQGGMKRIVELNNIKNRGPVAHGALYSYIANDDADYEQMFYSVKLIDGNEADSLRAKKTLQFELEKDRDTILAITQLLNSSPPLIQKDIVNTLTYSLQLPRRIIKACLRRWSCPAEEGGIWTISKGNKNSNFYKLN